MASSVPVSTSGESSATMSPPTTSSSSTSSPSTSSTSPSMRPPTPSFSTSSASPATTTGDTDYGFVITLIHRNVSQMVLYRVLQRGTPHKKPGVDMITYLKNLPSTSTSNYVNQKKDLKLDKNQKKMVNLCTSGEMFDVTLQVLFIKYACEGVKGLNDPSWCTDGLELENCIYMIKKQRNEAIHELLPITKAEFQNKEKDLRQLFIDTANALQQRYKDSMTIKERDDLIKEIEEKLDCIRDGDLPKLRRECQEELKTKLQLLKHFNPVSFIIGSNLALDVTLVFTDIEIGHREHQVPHIVSYQDFLVKIHEEQNRKVVLLEGVAGAGKTTLIRLMLQEWCAGHGNIKELNKYEVVLHVVCRDSSTDSYSSLLKNSIPRTFTQFKEDTLPLLAQCRILVLIDGLDEATQASNDLVKDVLHQLNSVDATIICATRPERSLDFQNMAGSSIPCMNASMQGIPVNKRLEFMEKNHRILKLQTNSGRDTEQLLQLMKEKIEQEHFRLPLNLILAVWVFDNDPDALGSTTTQTELYYHTHRLSKMKLQQRLQSKYPHMCAGNQASTIIMNLIKDWEYVLHRELLAALSLDQLVLSDEAVMRLQREAKTRDLPPDEMLGAFLTLKCIRIGLQKYSAPHKGIQDYYAALYIVEELKENQCTSRHKIMSILENAIGIGMNKVEVNKYQNVLQHVPGILHLFMAKVPNDLVEEVVELLGDAGVRNGEQWQDLIEDTKASPAVLAAIAKTAFPDKDSCITVRDGRVNACSALLPYLSPSRVKIDLDCVSTNLEPLVDSLDRHEYELRLFDSWRHPNPDFSPHPSIPKLLSRDGIVNFTGQWTSGMENMSSSLQRLWLSVADETKASQLVPLLHSLPHLKKLRLLVPPSVSPEGLTSLPTILRTGVVTGVHLELSDVRLGGESRACKVAAKLMPQNGYYGLSFPGATLVPEEWMVMLETLGRLGVRAKGIVVPKTSTPDKDILLTLAKQHLGARFERTDMW